MAYFKHIGVFVAVVLVAILFASASTGHAEAQRTISRVTYRVNSPQPRPHTYRTLAVVHRVRHRQHRQHRQHLRHHYWLPPHHLLWGCIHRYEGPWDDTSAPHAGGLQMTIGWEHLVGDAGYLSRAKQEWIAEEGYRENHYSTAFLYQQWFNWDGAASACLRYAG